MSFYDINDVFKKFNTFVNFINVSWGVVEPLVCEVSCIWLPLRINSFINTFSINLRNISNEMKNNKLVKTEIKKGDLSFFGESNPKTKEGRGVFYDAKNDKILITTWRDQDESTFGQIYNEVGHLKYEGEMVNGVAHGKGTFFFPGGEKYGV